MWIFQLLVLMCCVLHVYTFRSLSRCDTIHNKGHVISNCSSRNFDYIPWDLHHDIRTLDLSDNNISQLRANSFDKYSNIEKLFLQGNGLKEIKTGAFYKLERLKELDLSQNDFDLVPTKALADVPNLNVLSLRANRLNRLDKNSFQGLPFLRDLDLSGNHINIIAPYSFAGLDLLRSLQLQDNALQSLAVDEVFGLGRKLRTIKLYKNPWFCDCRLQWMKQWLNNGTLLYGLEWNYPGLGPKCAGPSLVQRKPISRVSLEHFACPIEMYTSGSRVFLKPGDSTALYCKYFSITESSVVWFKDNIQITNTLNPDKFKIIESGSTVKQSVLNIYDFRAEDEAEYRCLAENIRGSDYIKFVVAFEQAKPITPKELATATEPSPNKEKIIIAVSAVAGFIVLVIMICFIIRFAIRMKQREKQKRDEIRLQLKHHELETTNLGKSDDKLDGEDSSNDETMTKLHPEIGSIHSDNSFSNIYAPNTGTGNTYISFSSELTEPDPDDISQIYSAIRGNPPPPPGSHTESTTPLLDYYSPSVYESDEPIYDTRAYSVASVNVPHRTNYYIAQSYSPRTPGSIRSNNFYPDPRTNRSYDYADIQDYSRANYPDFSDYKDVYKLPCTANGKTLNNKKSASVGNLGPTGPRKPPRSFHTHTPRGTASELGGTNFSNRHPRLGTGDMIVKSNHMYRPPGVASSEIMGPTYSQPMRQYGLPPGPIYGANYNRNKTEMPSYELAKNYRLDNRPEILASNLSKGPQSVKSDTLGSTASQRTRSSVSSSDLHSPSIPIRNLSPSPSASKSGSPSTPVSPHHSTSSSITSPSSVKELPPGTPV